MGLESQKLTKSSKPMTNTIWVTGFEGFLEIYKVSQMCAKIIFKQTCKLK